METFIHVKDDSAAPPWWVILLPKGDQKTLLRLHDRFARQWWILDGRDPHNMRDRERDEKEGTLSIATLRHPTLLSAHWLKTAFDLFTETDLLIGSRGGMQPRSRLIELETRQADDWPPTFKSDRHIKIATWGRHFYLVSQDIAFQGKHNTEQEAMEVALRYAPADKIAVERQPSSFQSGD